RPLAHRRRALGDSSISLQQHELHLSSSCLVRLSCWARLRVCRSRYEVFDIGVKRFPEAREGVMNETGPELPLRGRCMCGAVRYEIDEPLLGALYCHCKRCQRRSGGPFSTTALTAPGSLRVVAGEERLKDYRPDGGYVKTFCGEC